MVIEKGFKYTGFLDDFIIKDDFIYASGQRELKKVTVESGESAEKVYLDFLKINLCDKKEILDFYNKYGSLTSEFHYYPESLNLFKKEAMRMRAIIGLKQALDENSYDQLLNYANRLFLTYADPENELKYILDGTIPIYDSYHINHIIKRIYSNASKEEIEKFEHEESGIFFLCGQIIDKVVNDYLKAISPFLTYYSSDPNSYHRGQWRINNLLSTMYFELFLRFTQNKKIRKCKSSTCPDYFEIKGNDTRKIYCGASCAALEAKRMERTRKKIKSGFSCGINFEELSQKYNLTIDQIKNIVMEG